MSLAAATAAATVTIVSAVVIIAPFVQAVRCWLGDDIDRRYAPGFFCCGLLALVWVGLTAARLVASLWVSPA